MTVDHLWDLFVDRWAPAPSTNDRNIIPRELRIFPFRPHREPSENLQFQILVVVKISVLGYVDEHAGDAASGTRCRRLSCHSSPCAANISWPTMLGNILFWILPFVLACHGVVLSDAHSATEKSARWTPRSRAGGRVKPPQQQGYVRMPVSRHKVKGRREHHGRPGKPPRPGRGPAAQDSSSATAPSLAPRRSSARGWGWSSLEELGGTVYIIECS